MLFLKTTRLFLLLGLFFLTAFLCAQTADQTRIAELRKEAAHFYVPYNDHGTWGWCDTLGRVTIAPTFKEQPGFFHPFKGPGGKYHLAAAVTSPTGKNYYKANGQLLFPKKYGLLHPLMSYPDSVSTDSYYIIQDKKQRFGVLSETLGKALVRTKYDSLNLKARYQRLILLKKKGDATWSRFDPASGKMVRTDITGVSEYSVNKKGSRFANSLFLLSHADGSWSRISYGKIVDYTFDEDSEYYQGDFAIEAPNDVSLSANGNSQISNPNGEIATLEFGTRTQLYGFTKLIIYRKEGKVGINNEKGETYLAPIYDEIEIDEFKSEARLKKDGLVGLRLFYTHHPTIPAKYKQLYSSNSITVTNRWRFGVFSATLPNGQKGFVGENAVEYFSFD